jgi:hypothetical protein
MDNINEKTNSTPESGTAPKRPAFCTGCGETLIEGQSFCPRCGQRYFNKPAANSVNPIPQYQPVNPMPQYQPVEEKQPKKSKNKFSLLAVIFGSIGIIPYLNFLFLPVALILGIIGFCTMKNKKKGLPIASAIILAIALIVSFAWLMEEFGTPDFNDTFSSISTESWCDINTDGTVMEIDTNPYDIEDYYNSTALSKIKTINSELGFSSSVYDDMMETRALDGRQYAYSENYTVSWTYHPDDGLEIIYKVK